jgi:hypothetical protein
MHNLPVAPNLLERPIHPDFMPLEHEARLLQNEGGGFHIVRYLPTVFCYFVVG